MANIFDAIGKGIGGTLEFAGNVAKGASDVFDRISTGPLTRAKVKQTEQATLQGQQDMNQKKLQMLNVSADMFSNSTEEGQSDVIAALTRAGYDPDAITLSQAMSKSKKPPKTVEDLNALAESLGLGVAIKTSGTGEVTEASFRTPTTTQAKQPTINQIIGGDLEATRLQRNAELLEKELTAFIKDDDEENASKVKKQLDEATGLLDDRVAKLGGFPVTTIPGTPAVTEDKKSLFGFGIGFGFGKADKYSDLDLI